MQPTDAGQLVNVPGTVEIGKVTVYGNRQCFVEYAGGPGWWATAQLTVLPAFEPDPPSELDEFADVSKQYYDEAHALLVKKHQDYGPGNIAGAPGGPLNGLQVRMYDKLARIQHLLASGVEPANESLKDSFVDLLNYSAIGLMVIDHNWPET